MKRTLNPGLCLLVMLLACPPFLRAQTSYPLLEKRKATSTSQQGTAEKSTAIGSRLIAEAGAEYDMVNYSFAITDSVFITYSGQRGGEARKQGIKFDNATAWKDNGGGLQQSEKYAQIFDGNDNILSTVIQEWNGTAWVNSYGRVSTYDANNNVLSQTELEWNIGNNVWDSLERYLYTYDMNNKLLSEVNKVNSGGVWENGYQYSHTLDMNGNTVLSVITYWNSGSNAWDSSGKLHYTFNTDNMVIEWWDESWQNNAWQIHSKYLTTYNQDDMPVTETRQSWNGSTWITARIVTNTYGNGDLLSVLEQYGNGDNLTLQSNAFDGNHNMLSSMDQYWYNNNYVNDRKMEFTYNSFNQVTSDKMFRWINNAWGHGGSDLANRYYYETYTTGIEKAKFNSEDLRVYPIPAANIIRVETKWEEPQPFTVSVIDMQGRLIRSYSEKATTNYSRTIDVHQLPPGNYVIKITGSKGKAAYRQFAVIQ